MQETNGPEVEHTVTSHGKKTITSLLSI